MMLTSFLRPALPGMLAAALLFSPGCAHRREAQPDRAAASVPTGEKPLPQPAADLKDREIDLLKRRLSAAQKELDTEKVGRLVYQTQAEVAALRGFRVHQPVTFEPLTTAKLNEILTDTFNRQFPGAALELYVWVNQLFGALPEGIDMLGYMKDLTTEQVAGLYDPLTRLLYVRTDFKLESPLGRMILAHEICHALQDQNHRLAEMGVDSADNGDLSCAVLSIAEGDATLLMSEYLTRYGNPLGLMADLPKMMLMDQQKLNTAPPAIQQSMLFPYLEGMKFFNTLAGRTRARPERHAEPIGESEWRSEIFADPPETTEQILHPEKYLARELPAPIRLPAAAFTDLKTSATNVLGEFGCALLLETYVGKPRATEAAAGWNGDRMLIGDDAEQTRHLLWITRWDTPADARQFAGALKDALTTRHAGTLQWRDAARRLEGTAPGTELVIQDLNDNEIRLEGRFKPAGQTARN